MSNVIIYTKDNCHYCVQAKRLFEQKSQTYKEIRIGFDITREEFMITFPEVKSVPFIIIDGEQVGGYDKLSEWYNRPEQQFLAE
jgi:glutaredoxin 3